MKGLWCVMAALVVGCISDDEPEFSKIDALDDELGIEIAEDTRVAETGVAPDIGFESEVAGSEVAEDVDPIDDATPIEETSIEPDVATEPDITIVPEDTSTTPEDTSTTPVDTSTTPEDTSTTPEDTATTPEDTATTPEDTATMATDTSTPIEDTAPPPEDSASPIEDTATPIEDTNSPLEDTAPVEDTSPIADTDPIEVGPTCPTSCTAWETTCSGSGGYKLCVPDTESGCNAPSGFIGCQEGNVCANGECTGACTVPEVLFVVDRSSSMAGARWDMTRSELVAFTARYGPGARIGVRMFPGSATCGASDVVPLAMSNSAAIEAGLVAPANDSSSPFAAALTALGAHFGEPDQGERVVLLSDGSESCADPEDAIDAAAEIRARGAIVDTIGLGTTFDGELLYRIAETGGGTHYGAASAAALKAILGTIAGAATGCAQGEDGAYCEDGTCHSGPVACPSDQVACDGGTTCCHWSITSRSGWYPDALVVLDSGDVRLIEDGYKPSGQAERIFVMLERHANVWSHHEIAGPGEAMWSAAAFDANGNAAVMHKTSFSDLLHFNRLDANGWSAEFELVSDGVGFAFGGMVFGPNGVAHAMTNEWSLIGDDQSISYRTAAPTGSWSSPELVESWNEDLYIQHAKIAVGPGGQPCVVWLEMGDDLTQASVGYSCRVGGQWARRAGPAPSNFHEIGAVAFDSAGDLHVLVVDHSAHLRVLRRASNGGWTSPTVVTAEVKHATLATDRKGHLRMLVSPKEVPIDNLWRWNGSTWIEGQQVPVEANAYGLRLAFDRDNDPVFGFGDENQILKLVELVP